MKNNTTRTIRSEEITIDVRICATLAANRGGEVYLAAIAPDMELTIITLDEAPGILPCFEEDDACLNLPNTSLLLCYNPAQVLKMGGKSVYRVGAGDRIIWAATATMPPPPDVISPNALFSWTDFAELFSVLSAAA